jgi:hypothetical protein
MRVEKCGAVNWTVFLESHQVSPIFIKYSCTKFREYITGGLVTDTVADGRTDVTLTKCIILLLRNRA